MLYKASKKDLARLTLLPRKDKTAKTGSMKTNPLNEKAPPVSDDEVAARFERIRRAHQSEVAEDYVEMIAELIAETGEARAVDLASRFGVTAPTVTATIQRLVREGLVETQPYRSIFLTEAGRTLASNCANRHAIVRDFLIAIGVDAEIAEADAEGLEHHVSPETLEAFKTVIARQSEG